MKRLLVLLVAGVGALALAVGGSLVAVGDDGVDPRGGVPTAVVLFASPDCDDCQVIKARWAGEVDPRGGLRLVAIAIDLPANFILLDALEQELRVVAAGDLPAAYAGGQMHYGLEAIEAHWSELLAAAQAATSWPRALAELPAVLAARPGEPIIDYVAVASAAPPPDTEKGAEPSYAMLSFRLPGCADCSRQENALLLLERERPSLTISRYDLTTAEGQAALALALAYFGVGEAGFGVPPILVWPESWVAGRNLGLAELRERLRPLAGPPFWSVLAADQLHDQGVAVARRRFEGFSLGLVIAGGLIDGVNPCAFAAVVFLVSYIAYLGRDRRTIAWLGGSFCAGVFVAYFLVGVGLSALLNLLQDLVWLKIGIYAALGLLGVALGVAHLRDAVRFRRSGRTSDMEAGLSTGATRQIHAWIRRLANGKWLLPAGFALGLVVSMLELACTGQIYLPILSIINREGMSMASLGLLLIYCAAFILPLVVVTTLAAAGIQTKAMANWARRNLVGTKTIMAVLFFVLGAVMLGMAWQALA